MRRKRATHFNTANYHYVYKLKDLKNNISLVKDYATKTKHCVDNSNLKPVPKKRHVIRALVGKNCFPELYNSETKTTAVPTTDEYGRNRSLLVPMFERKYNFTIWDWITLPLYMKYGPFGTKMTEYRRQRREIKEFKKNHFVRSDTWSFCESLIEYINKAMLVFIEERNNPNMYAKVDIDRCREISKLCKQYLRGAKSLKVDSDKQQALAGKIFELLLRNYERWWW